MPNSKQTGKSQDEITIADVAQAAGVSISTVSRVLNEKPDVAESTRKRVMQVIDKLGYQPYVQVSERAVENTNQIALVYPLGEGRSSLFTQLELNFMIAASNAAMEEGFALQLITGALDAEGVIDLYRSRQVNGVILMEILADDPRVQALQSANLPFVIIGRTANNKGICYIDTDAEMEVVRAFQHLIELGHHHIGFIIAPEDGLTEERSPVIYYRQGYEKILRLHNIPRYSEVTGYSVLDSYHASLRLLENHPQITGIVTTRGVTADGIYRALREKNICVPGDFSVVGIAPSGIAGLLHPPLTSLDFPAYELGYRATKMLINRLEKESSVIEQTLVPTELTVRSSSGPARK